MKITINIDDELVPSFEQFMAAHYTGQPFTVEEFILFQIQNLIQQVGTDFPSASVAADRAEIKVIEERIKDRLKPIIEPKGPQS